MKKGETDEHDALAAHPSAQEVARLYHDHATDWPALRGTDGIERGWMAAFHAALPRAAGARILDLGCGSGVPIARDMIARGHHLTGVDAAPAMIAAARAAFPDAIWQLADMRALPAMGRFDGIIAWHSFFHLPQGDQRGMIASFARLAAPDAALVFTSGPAEGEAIGSFQGKPLYHASLSPAEYRALLAAHGFEVLRYRAEDPDCGGATVWLARYTGA